MISSAEADAAISGIYRWTGYMSGIYRWTGYRGDYPGKHTRLEELRHGFVVLDPGNAKPRRKILHRLRLDTKWAPLPTLGLNVILHVPVQSYGREATLPLQTGNSERENEEPYGKPGVATLCQSIRDGGRQDVYDIRYAEVQAEEDWWDLEGV